MKGMNLLAGALALLSRGVKLDDGSAGKALKQVLRQPPQFRGPTPPRRRQWEWVQHERGHMAKAFRNYAVRYATKHAILNKRAELEAESRIAQRSGQPQLAKRLMDRSVTWPR